MERLMQSYKYKTPVSHANSASEGGAIDIQQGHLRATDCTFVDNRCGTVRWSYSWS